jgi:4-carboxymuconolactone decarboxylase
MRLLHAPCRIAAALVAAAALLAITAAHAAPRIAPVLPSERSAEQRALAERFASIGMQNEVATYLRYPALAAAILPYTEYLLNASKLPPRDRELLWLRTAWLAHSSYVWAQRAPVARSLGITPAELVRIAAGPDEPGWQPFDAALLRAADELHVDAFVSDATWRTLAKRYDANQLTDLLYGVGEIAMHADVANTLRIEAEPDRTDRLPSGVPQNVSARWSRTRLVGHEPRIAPLAPTGGGPAANVFRTFARNPPADELRNAVGRHIRDATSLPPRYRQTLIMRVGVLCRAEYEWAAHSRIGRQVGLNDADVARIVAGPASPGDDALATLLLRAADELYRDDAIADDTWTALETRLTVPQLFDAMITVGGYRSASYAINSAGVQLDANMAEFRFPPELR